MDFEAAFVIELKSIAALNNRVYPLVAPEQKFDLTQPYLIYLATPGLRTKDLSTFQTGQTIRGELNIIAPRYLDAHSITTIAIDKLISMQGRAIAETGPFIQEVVYRQPLTFYEEKPKLYRCMVEFEVYF
jgi:hypothetical protein